MTEENKHNLLYFEGSSMRELFNSMQTWQGDNRKRLLSVSVQRDGDKFCCIALTNPTEVVIVDGCWSGIGSQHFAAVDGRGALVVTQSR